jgi:chemotaxis protein MotB
VFPLRHANCFSLRVAEAKQVSEGAPERRSRSRAPIFFAIVLAAIGGWWWSTQRSGAESPGTAGYSAIKSTLHLETFVVNLADRDQRSYLRVGVDLGLNRELRHGEEVPVARVRDAILGVLASAKVDDLLSAAGKAKLKADLLQALQARVPELGVEDVYASAQVDQRKVGKLALAIQVAFQELGVFPASTTQIPLDTSEPMPFSTVQAIQNVKHNAELGPVVPSPQGTLQASSQEAEGALSTLQSDLEDALGHEISMHEVTLHRETEGLVISMREFGFFDSGSGTLRASALPTLDRIATLLAVRTYRLRVEGHTDNVPIHTAQISSNWELSTARATELVRLLIVRYRFDPKRLAAAGYAEYHPIASNETEQGRALNRRVDIVILK